MKLVGVLCVMLVAAAWGAPQDKYSNKYDNTNVDNILKNERLVTQYVKCFLDNGPCTAEGRAFKDVLPDALVTSCRKCNDTQKTNIRKAIKHIMDNRPQDWEAIKKKYDPKGEHHSSFTAFIAGK